VRRAWHRRWWNRDRDVKAAGGVLGFRKVIVDVDFERDRGEMDAANARVKELVARTGGEMLRRADEVRSRRRYRNSAEGRASRIGSNDESFQAHEAG